MTFFVYPFLNISLKLFIMNDSIVEFSLRMVIVRKEDVGVDEIEFLRNSNLPANESDDLLLVFMVRHWIEWKHPTSTIAISKLIPNYT